MRKQAIAAIDIGTQSAKCIVFDFHGSLLTSASRGYSWIQPDEGMFEIRPDDIWDAAQDVLDRCVKKTSREYELRAISFAYFGHGMLTVDEKYRPTGNIILLADIRASDMTYDMRGADQILMDKTRSSAFNTRCIPLKVYWLKKNMPDVYSRTAQLFDIQQYILAKLGLEPVNDGTMASCKDCLDVAAEKWSPEIMDAFCIPRSWLTAQVVGSDYIAGKVTKFGSVDLGGEVYIMPGAHDTESGVLGMGAIPDNPGVLSDSMGTYHQCGFLSEHPEGSLPETGWASFITKCGRYKAHMNSTSNGGSAMSWFIRTFCGGEPIYDELFAPLHFDGTNPSMFCPTFSHRNAAIGFMTLSRTREQIFEALIEGITFELAGGYDKLRSRVAQYQGGDIKEIRAMGGGSQADKFLQLRATVFGIPIVRGSHIQGTGAGAAMLAAVGMGAYKDYKEASDNMVALTDRFEPNPDLRPVYLKKLEKYLKWRQTL